MLRPVNRSVIRAPTNGPNPPSMIRGTVSDDGASPTRSGVHRPQENANVLATKIPNVHQCPVSDDAVRMSVPTLPISPSFSELMGVVFLGQTHLQERLYVE